MRTLHRLCWLILIWGCWAAGLCAQVVEGQWLGTVQQGDGGGGAAFAYSVTLRVDEGGAVSGLACSRTPDGGSEACFVVSGVWDGRQLLLQEVRQTKPATPKWCLKYATLAWQDEAGVEVLRGTWTAKGCEPGLMELRRAAAPDLVAKEAFSPLGRWTGHLDQSDRAYGFYYELVLGAGGTGTAVIVSEGNGGTAEMALRWELVEGGTAVAITETGVREKTNPSWPWCLKSAKLPLRRSSKGDVLAGSWTGYIEQRDPVAGACAPGKLYLERPVVSVQLDDEIKRQQAPYERDMLRSVKIDRVVEVYSADVRIKVWDNGAVDGDIATIFLNGERILNKYTVSKRKRSIPVTLKAEDNLLILHAEDLGEIPPNTVAVSIDDGRNEQIIILTSNLDVSGAILIKHFRVK